MARKTKTHTQHHDVSTGLYLVAMVGIVAVIGMVVLVMNSGSSATYDYDDLAGQGYAHLVAGCSSTVSPSTIYGIYNPNARTWVPMGIMKTPFESEEEQVEDPEESMGSSCYEECEGICMGLPEDQLSGCLDDCDDICI